MDQTPALICVPESISDLRDYLGDREDRVRPLERRVVLGYWENEIVYVNLNRPVELRDRVVFGKFLISTNRWNP
jgi:hypothetical protein